MVLHRLSTASACSTTDVRHSTVSATLTSYKTVTAPGTTTVVVNAKRDVEEIGSQLEDRAVLDFAYLASLAGLNLAVTSVSTACSCFVSSSYTAPTATTTALGASTVTVAVAKATAIVTTTVLQNTV